MLYSLCLYLTAQIIANVNPIFRFKWNGNDIIVHYNKIGSNYINEKKHNFVEWFINLLTIDLQFSLTKKYLVGDATPLMFVVNISQSERDELAINVRMNASLSVKNMTHLLLAPDQLLLYKNGTGWGSDERIYLPFYRRVYLICRMMRTTRTVVLLVVYVVHSKRIEICFV